MLAASKVKMSGSEEEKKQQNWAPTTLACVQPWGEGRLYTGYYDISSLKHVTRKIHLVVVQINSRAS